MVAHEHLEARQVAWLELADRDVVEEGAGVARRRRLAVLVLAVERELVGQEEVVRGDGEGRQLRLVDGLRDVGRLGALVEHHVCVDHGLDPAGDAYSGECKTS